ncbi:MAG: mandelate racemase/muconate lactonizing enzyme family protein [Saprospiraceae bacterium]
MRRRGFIQQTLGGIALAGLPSIVQAKSPIGYLPKLKITKINFYKAPQQSPTFNQSNSIVTIETDQGITGIGEGGSKDMIEQLAGLLIGQNPLQIEHLWQFMYRAYFYTPGREKIHALGALDMALWDIKGKVLGVPVHALLGGLTRNHIECYSTGFPWKGSLKDTAKACIESGFRAYRAHGADGKDGIYDQHKQVEDSFKACQEIKEGVGEGDWAIDFHTRLDLQHAIRLSNLIEPLSPFFVEDLVRSENKMIYRQVRQKVNVPIAVGEHFGDKWDIRPLIEENLIDFSRLTLPNTGGITEFKKIAALCETHYIGLVPHFTGPIATAALLHACGSSSGIVLMEMRGEKPREEPHLPVCLDFRDGKLWPNDRPGLGVTFDPTKAELLGTFTEYIKTVPTFVRPDGSITNW